MKTDYEKTGKLYAKLDAYVIENPPYNEHSFYLGSSCQFKTMKGYLSWLKAQSKFMGLVLKIRKGEP